MADWFEQNQPKGGQDWFASNAPKEAPAGPPNPSMNATISAPPAPTGIGGKVSQWAKDASGDIRYGGDKTVVGRALHAVGAKPLYEGAPSQVADYMGSPALGALKATQGAGKLATPGKPLG